MADLVRLSLSIEKPLFRQLEKMVKQGGYTNRSEFIRDMIRQKLVDREWDGNRQVLGTLTLVYDHHVRRLGEKLTDIQHHHHGIVMATTHVHLDQHLCAEAILLKGRASQIKQLADSLGQQKGVLHAELSAMTTGTAIK